MLPVEWWCVCRWTYSRSISAPAMFCRRIPLRAAPPWTSRSSLRPPPPPCWHNNRASGPSLYPITAPIEPQAWIRCAEKTAESSFRATLRADSSVKTQFAFDQSLRSNGVSLRYVTGQRSCDLQENVAGWRESRIGQTLVIPAGGARWLNELSPPSSEVFHSLMSTRLLYCLSFLILQVTTINSGLIIVKSWKCNMYTVKCSHLSCK